jgi:uncharacterized protein (TIGR01777 family)
MKIAITGASGLVGAPLRSVLQTAGHACIGLVRTGARPSWDPATGVVSPGALDGIDAVVHLAGENIAGGRWSVARKQRIRDSRVEPTRRLSETLARLATPPRVLIAASAIGYYGDRGDVMVDETTPAGSGFLPEVCRAWEAATDPAVEAGIRVVHLRTGIVLTAAGGALGKMLLPFKMGVGGVIGSGAQYMSWVAIDDLLGATLFSLTKEDVRGPVNVVAPAPVTNREFTRTLGRVLDRPTILPMPAFAARLAFGEMADALLLQGARVHPVALLDAGYQFAYPTLDGALRHVLDR